MPEVRKKYDRRFRDRAVRRVLETGRSIAQVARELGVNPGTLGNWVANARESLEGDSGLTRDELAELKRLRAENAKLRVERDVLKRSVVLRLKKAMR
jgi:transposase